MAFSYENKRGQMYHLHTKLVTLKSTGRKQQIFFFSKVSSESTDLPDGFKVIENPRTGLPFLKRK